MILGLMVLFPLFGVALWVYLRFQPQVEASQRRALYLFNGTITGFLLVLFMGSAAYFWKVLYGTVDSGWWLILAVLFSLFSSAVILFLATLVRNTVLFRAKKGSLHQ